MPYVQDRTIHDADAHVMEVPGFLDDFVEARFRPALQEACLFERRKGFWESLPTLERVSAAGTEAIGVRFVVQVDGGHRRVPLVSRRIMGADGRPSIIL